MKPILTLITHRTGTIKEIDYDNAKRAIGKNQDARVLLHMAWASVSANPHIQSVAIFTGKHTLTISKESES